MSPDGGPDAKLHPSVHKPYRDHASNSIAPTIRSSLIAMNIPASLQKNIDSFTGRSWLLPPLIHWLDQTLEQHFIIQGAPGTGKSMIMAWLAGAGPVPTDNPASEQLARLRSQVKAAHFCVATSGTTEPRAIAKNIAQQLTETVEGFGEALLKTVPEQIKISVTQKIEQISDSHVTGVAISSLNMGSLGDEASFNRLVREPIKQLYADGYSQPIMLLIDSLDEAETYTGDITIGRLLSKLDDLPEQVRFVMTTRPDPRILDHFNAQPFDLIDNAPATATDIQQYVYEQLKAFEDPRRSHLTQTITQSAKGIFLYAYLALSELLQNSSDTSISTDSIAAEMLTSLPEGLSGIYHNFLTRELGDDDADWYDLFAPLLGAIAVSQNQGFSRGQLAGLLQKDANQIARPLRSCAQYLRGTPDGPFTVFHKSFSDFLLEDDENATYHIYAFAIHRRIVDYYWQRYAPTWHECDHYGLEHLPFHLAESIAPDEDNRSYLEKARQLLTNFDWLQTKLSQINIYDVIKDYALLSNPDLPDLKVIQEALQLSAHILRNHPDQLSIQLRGRLIDVEDPRCQTLLQQSLPTDVKPQLSFISSGFAKPGDRLKRVLTGHDSNVRAVAITPDGQSIISGSGDNTLKVWDLMSGEERYTLTGHEKPIKSVAVDDKNLQIVSASDDNTLRVWNIATRKTRFILTGHKRSVKAVAIDPGGQYAVSASEDHTLRRWNLSTGKEHLPALSGHHQSVESVAITPDGNFIISGSRDNSLRVWDASTGENVQTFDEHSAAIRSIAVTPDSQWAVSASSDKTMIVWNLTTGEKRFPPLLGHTDQVQSVAITPDGQHLVSAAYDNSLKVWDLKTGKEWLGWHAHAAPVLAVAISPDAQWLVSASRDTTIKVWQMNLPVQKATADFGHTSKVSAIAITPTAAEVMACSSSGLFKSWNRQTGETRTIAQMPTRIDAAAIAPDGSQAILGLRGSRVQWARLTPFSLQELTYDPLAKRFSLAAISANHHTAAAMSSQGTLIVFDIASSSPETTGMKFDFQPPYLSSLAISAAKKQLVLGLPTGNIKGLCLETRRSVFNFPLHPCAAVTALSISANHNIVVGGASNGMIKVFDLDGGEAALFELAGHADKVTAIAIAENAPIVVSVSRDAVMKIWNLIDGQQIATFTAESALSSCCLTQNGKTIAIGEVSGRIHLLELT